MKADGLFGILDNGRIVLIKLPGEVPQNNEQSSVTQDASKGGLLTGEGIYQQITNTKETL